MEKKITRDWEICEIEKRLKYLRQGCSVVTTGKGSDFLAICPDKKLTFVEVKKGCQPLTKLQRKTMEDVRKSGSEYEIERCDCRRSNRGK